MPKDKPESGRTLRSEKHVGSEMRPRKTVKMTSHQATIGTTDSQTVTSANPPAPGETKEAVTEEEEDAVEQETSEGTDKRDSPKGDRGPEKRPKRISVKQN